MRALPLLLLTLAAPAIADDLKLNQIQAIGSHNSYHVAPPPALIKTIRSINKNWSESWNYTHPPLAEQLELGIRQFELDIFVDTKGGLFANPLAVKLAKLAGENPPAFDPAGELAKPGIKVMHVPDMDCWSTVPRLKMALEEIRAWSDQHPRHLPVMILLECKDQPQPPLPVKPEAFSRERLLDLEQEILAVIPARRILKPDDIRGDAATLREAVLKKGWPALDTLRGKFLFALDNTDDIRGRYLEGNPALEGRLIFASAPDETHPAAAWFKCNDPEKEQEKIRELVKAGYLVRTRADTGKPDPEMKAKAFESGAQWISTDRFKKGADQQSLFDGDTMARENPVSSGGTKTIEP